MLCAKFTFIAPLIEIVAIGQGLDVGIERVCAGEIALFIGVNGVSGATAGDFALSLANIDDGSVAGFVDVDTIATGAKNGESKIGSVDFDGFIVTDAANAKVQSAFGKTNLHHAVVEIQEGETGFAGKIKNRGADLKFGAGIFVGPEFIADSERAIEDRRNPIIGSRWAEGNVAVGVAETGNAAGRIIVVRHSAIGCEQKRGKDQGQQRQQTALCTCTHRFSSLLVSKAFPIEIAKRIPRERPGGAA